MGLPRDKAGLRQLLPKEISTDGVAAICAVGRQLAQRLDTLIDVMQKQAGGPGVLPGARTIAGAPSGLELLALMLASFPRTHATITITTSATALSQNTTGLWGAVAVANNDLAQKLYYGSGTVAQFAAPFIPPDDQKILYIAPGETLYGIVGGASITAGVSTLLIPRMR